MRATTAVYGHPIPRNRNAGPYLVTSPTGIPGLRKQLVSIWLIAVYMMLLMIVYTLEYWNRLQLLGPKLRVIIIILAAAAYMVAAIHFDGVSQWFFWTLPGNFLGALAVMCAILAAILLGLDAMFRRTEFVNKAAQVRL